MELNESNVVSEAMAASEKVTSKSTTSIQVLESLGNYLSNESLGQRKLGATFLSAFLSNLDRNFLNADECGLFANFYKVHKFKCLECLEIF
jgi:hypothetical protein